MNQYINFFKKINPYYYYYVLWLFLWLLIIINKYNFTLCCYVIESIKIFSRGLIFIMFLTFFKSDWVKQNRIFIIIVNVINLCILIADMIYTILFIK
jgi:hypothetical protein